MMRGAQIGARINGRAALNYSQHIFFFLPADKIKRAKKAPAMS
jgi:hypothetical protein